MPLAGLILNRVHRVPAIGLSAARALAAAETLEPDGSSVAVAALRLHAERMTLSDREQRVAAAFTSAHPAVPVVEIPAFPADVHDLEGLRRLAQSALSLVRR